MDKSTIETFGGAYTDAEVVTNPETEMAADEGNLLIESVAQGTYTSPATIGTFTTTATAAPTTVAAANVTHSSHWGSGSGTKPTVSKTATGRYTLTFPSSWTNGIGTSENVSLFEGDVIARSSDAADDLDARVLSISTNVVTIVTQSPRGTDADAGDNSAAAFTIGWRFYA